MATKEDTATISSALDEFHRSGHMEKDIEARIRKFLEDEDEDILALLQGDLSQEQSTNPIVCCYIGYSGYRYKWLRADVCARFGTQVLPGQEHKCGAEP